MYVINVCRKLSENKYDSRIDLSQKEELSDKYNLTMKGGYKEYWENNVCILLSKDSRSFNYIEDISITYTEETQHLIRKIKKTPCPPYNFYNVSHEESYILYENESDHVLVQLKEYSTYMTLTLETEDLNYIKKQCVFLI
jgi:hypothetical protein